MHPMIRIICGRITRLVKGKFVLSDTPGLGLELDESELLKRVIPWTSSAPNA
jgi:hypothetical protein